MGHPAHARAHNHAAASAGYARRCPETTALYQAVAEHWPGFRERVESLGGLPRFVTEEFDAYLGCGILERGCLHLSCRQCGHSQLVAFSCKKRGFCPSCTARRMSDVAVHLEESVLPRVPVRHWICSLPWGVRALLGYDRKLCAEVTSAFATELSRSLQRRAKRALSLDSVRDAHTGLVVAVQRTDSALRLNVHFHVLALDGAYVRDAHSGELVFESLDTPTRAESADVAARTAERIARIFDKHSRSLDPEMTDSEPHALELDEPGLSACYDAAARGIDVTGTRAGQPTLRLVVSQDPPALTDDALDEPVANVRGVNLYAKQRVDGRDRKQLERLCRYVTRPPVAEDRLERRADGRFELAFKSVWKDGTRALVLEGQDLIARLVAAVPPPRFHLVRYFGVLSSHSSRRSEVVPTPPDDPTTHAPPAAPGDQLELPTDEALPAARKRWGWLLKHVFQADVDTCARCGGPMRWLEVATSSDATARLMADHGLGPRPPPSIEVRLGPEQLAFWFI